MHVVKVEFSSASFSVAGDSIESRKSFFFRRCRQPACLIVPREEGVAMASRTPFPHTASHISPKPRRNSELVLHRPTIPGAGHMTTSTPQGISVSCLLAHSSMPYSSQDVKDTSRRWQQHEAVCGNHSPSVHVRLRSPMRAAGCQQRRLPVSSSDTLQNHALPEDQVSNCFRHARIECEHSRLSPTPEDLEPADRQSRATYVEHSAVHTCTPF